MLAYIIFLIVAIVYKIICYSNKQSFEAWDRLIVATTLSTYCFSCGEIFKTIYNLAADFKEKTHELENRVNCLITSLNKQKEVDSVLQLKANELRKTITETVEKENFTLNYFKHAYNMVYVVGFVVFFCVSIMDIIKVSSYDLEIMVMAAFVAMLFADYMYDVLKRKNDKKFAKLNEAFDTIIELENINSNEVKQ